MSICIRVLLSRAFHSQPGTSLAGSSSRFRDGRSAYTTCNNGIFEFLCRHSKDLHSQPIWGRIGEADLQMGSKSHCGAWVAILRRLGQGAICESKVAPKVRGHSMSSLKMNATAYRQRAWQRLYDRNGFIHGQRVWREFYARHSFCRPLLPPFGLVVRAVSLACARSHLSLGVVAVIVGGLNQRIAEAEQSHGQPLFYSLSHLPPGYILSFLFSALEFLALFIRAIYLVILFMPAVLSAPFADSFGSQFRQTWLHLVHHSLEFAGPAFIKWGQWAATRPDLFPKDLCLELSKLHAKAPAHKFSHTRQTVEGAFGRKIHELFEDFEEEPVASGSIAQVHKATLHFNYPGQKAKPMLVAVKVRHPRVGDVIRRDFILINWIARICTLVPGLRWLRLDESVQQFAVFMLTQVDLAREAAHLSRFLYNFRSWKDVSFPKPLYPLVHPAVLVETYEQGECVSRFVELSEKSRINSALAHIGTHTLLKMLLVDNFIHADMHPGNILVRVEKRKGAPGKGLFRSRPHVIFLDVGMTAELSKNDRSNLLDFFKAVALRDGRTAAECALKFSKDQSCPNPAAFIEEIETSFKFWGSEEGDYIHPGDCMQNLLEQVRRHRVNVDGDVCTVMVTTMVLEGWQRKLDPEYNIMHTLQTLMFKVDWAKSLSYTINGIMAP